MKLWKKARRHPESMITYVIGVLCVIVAATLLPPKTNVVVVALYGLGVALISIATLSILDLLVKPTRDEPTPVHVSFDEFQRQYAESRWQQKLDGELQQIVDAKRICKCGHAKTEHVANPLVRMMGLGWVQLTGQALDCCMNGYADGQLGCSCPGFLEETSVDS